MKADNGDRANIGLFRTTAEAHYYKGTVPFQTTVLRDCHTGAYFKILELSDEKIVYFSHKGPLA